MKPKYVYHGSARELEGDKLVPRQARDLSGDEDNSQKAVYASSRWDEAMAMGILKCRGVKNCSIHMGGFGVDAIIYDGWPDQDYFYFYTLPSDTFENKPRGSHQYVSLVPVKPSEIKILAVKDYISLVRRATDEERKNGLKNSAPSGADKFPSTNE